jgi:transcriptional regulator with XRE-family HTH domain
MRKLIKADDLHREWMKNPAYRKAYDELEEEYQLASAMIAARAKARLTQEELAKRMNTTQTAIARLESGRVMPSTRTLDRLAKATGHRLRISFEPIRKQTPERPQRSAARG